MWDRISKFLPPKCSLKAHWVPALKIVKFIFHPDPGDGIEVKPHQELPFNESPVKIVLLLMKMSFLLNFHLIFDPKHIFVNNSGGRLCKHEQEL